MIVNAVKDQLFCLVSYLLNTNSSKSELLDGFLKWFSSTGESSMTKVRM